jgi:succinyl-diaminopimelate desuccinylase
VDGLWQELAEKIKGYEEELVSSLSELIQIPSVRKEPVVLDGELLPFGQEVHNALLYMHHLARKEGFSFFDVDHYGGHMDYGVPKEKTLGILLHLDVVPEGTGWDMDPFGGQVVGDRIYGRGALDDKGPTIAVFYALKALKDLGYEPEVSIRLVFGLDEETGWSGMDYYLARQKAPDFGFTPDAEFPAISGEKGILVFDVVKKLSKTVGLDRGLELRSLKGGHAANMVADYARALLFQRDAKGYEEIKERVSAMSTPEKGSLRCRHTGKSLEVVAEGVSAHGAKPEHGFNAISLLMDFLGQLTFAEDDVNDFIQFYNQHIGYEVSGKGLNLDLEDEESGKLILNIGKAYMNSKEARITVNIRYPVTYGEEEIYRLLMEILTPCQMGIIKTMVQHPIYFSKEDPFIRKLMGVYAKVTGDGKSQPLVIGGGTYARAMDQFVAFGPSFPGEREVAHQKNEYMEISKLMTAAVIYGQAIYELTCEKV